MKIPSRQHMCQAIEENNEKDVEEKPALTGKVARLVLGEVISILDETEASRSMSAKYLPSVH